MVINMKLEKYTDDGGNVVLSDNITEICFNAFSEREDIKGITIPNSVKIINERAFSKLNGVTFTMQLETALLLNISCFLSESYYMEENFICPRKICHTLEIIVDDKTKVNMYLVLNPKGNAMGSYEPEDCVYEELYISEKSLLMDKYDKSLTLSSRLKVDDILHAMLGRLLYPYELSEVNREIFTQYIVKNVNKAAQIALNEDNSGWLKVLFDVSAINKGNKSKMLSLAKDYDAPRCKAILENSCSLITAIKDTPELNKSVKSNETTNPIEVFCKEKFDLKQLDKVMEKIHIHDAQLGKVKYKNSIAIAPSFVVKCAILPYSAQLEARPHQIGSYKTEYKQFNFNKDADEVAETLDSLSLQELLGNFVEDQATDDPALLIPFGRYASAAQIKSLSTKMNHWSNWDTYSSKGRSTIIVARGAALLNDSREAMLFADRNKCMSFYARIRGMSESSLRDSKLADFGFDKVGNKYYDIGKTTIRVSIDDELGLSLFDVGTGKTIKSIPKKDADAEKYDIASADFADMKKNVKAVVRNRITLFKYEFVNEKTQSATDWKISYIGNPLLGKLAQLMVWKFTIGQITNYFTLSNDGAILSDETIFNLVDDGKVSVANPVEMSASEIKAWQTYFVSHRLKQPFEQIWATVVSVNKKAVEQRYNGREAQMSDLIGLTYKGFEISGGGDSAMELTYSSSFSMYFNEASPRGVHSWKQIYGSETVVFGATKCSSRMSNRSFNHVVAQLDKITIMGQIDADDPSVKQYLDSFTVVQVSAFLKYAIENKKANCTAVLLDYYNKHFAEFATMDEFVLE